MKATRLTRDRALILFFILAFAISWSIAVPLGLANQGLGPPLPPTLHFLVAFGPAVAAIIVTALTGGRAGLRELGGRLVKWRVGWPVFLFAVFSPFVFFLIALVPARLIDGVWSLDSFGFVTELGVRGLTGWFVWLFTFALGEETGWRGFALPRLQHGRSAARATAILAAVWAAWHLPFFLYNYEFSLFGMVALFVSLFFGTVVLTGLYNAAAGSVLMTIFWHASLNTVTAGAEGITAALVSAQVILLAIYLGRRYGPESFAPREKHSL